MILNIAQILCLSCNKLLPSDCFHKNKSRHNGHAQYCVPCKRSITRRVDIYMRAMYTGMYYRQRKIKRYMGLECNVTWEDFQDICTKCHYNDLHTRWAKSKFMHKYAPSVDRINNELGYTAANIQILPFGLNTAKDCGRPGEANSQSKLSENDVIKIHSLRNVRTPRQLAELYNVTQGTIYRILNGNRWGYLNQKIICK